MTQKLGIANIFKTWLHLPFQLQLIHIIYFLVRLSFSQIPQIHHEQSCHHVFCIPFLDYPNFIPSILMKTNLQDTGENIKENCYPHPIPRLVLWLHVRISPNISYAICNSIAALHWKYLSHTWHYKVLDHMNLIFFFLLLYSPCKSMLLAFMKSCSIRKLCHLDSRFWQTLTSMAHSEWCSLVESFLDWFCAWS